MKFHLGWKEELYPLPPIAGNTKTFPTQLYTSEVKGRFYWFQLKILTTDLFRNPMRSLKGLFFQSKRVSKEV